MGIYVCMSLTPIYWIIYRNIMFDNNAAEIEISSESRYVSLSLTDDKGSFSQLVNVTVDIRLTDDAPVALFGRSFIDYTEGDGVLLLGDKITVSDVDSDELKGASIYFSSPSGLNFSVEFLFIPQDSLNGTNITADFYNGNLSLVGVATLDTYQTVLRNLSYNLTVQDPASGPRHISMFVVSVNEDRQSMMDTVVIQFSTFNNPPILDLNGPQQAGLDNEVLFTEEGRAVPLTRPGLTLFDVDSPQLLNASVVISNRLDGALEDLVLIFNSSLDVSFQNGSGNLVINGPGSVEDFKQILAAVQYINRAGEPSEEKRTIVFEVWDELSPVRQITMVTIMLTNDDPVLQIGPQVVEFIEGGPPIPIINNVSITDPDGEVVSTIRITTTASIELDSLIGLNVSLYQDVDMGYIYEYAPPISIPDANSFLRSLQYQNQIDEPTVGKRTICVTVTDEVGATSNEECVEISIMYINDHTPVFLYPNYTGRVPENVASGSTVLQVSATDGDSMSIVYTITQGDCLNGVYTVYSFVSEPCPFYLDPYSGNFTTTNETLDFETQSIYQFVVRASDGEQWAEVNVTILVEDVDDNEPMFTEDKYEFRVPQGAVVGEEIGYVVAEDLDSGRNAEVQYSCVGGHPLSPCDLFEISGTSGAIVLKRDENMMDETVGRYMLEVQGFSPSSFLIISTYVCINVSLNENTPLFELTQYDIDVNETALTGEIIAVILATDPDEGSHGNVTYSLYSNELVPFTVDYLSGAISASRPLDYDSGDQVFTFSITAADQGRPLRSSTVPVDISVRNVNDHIPMFAAGVIYEGVVCENETAANSLVQVEATDSDLEPFGTVQYFLVNDFEGRFAIGQDDGLISIVEVPDYESGSADFVLEVGATDSELSNFVNVTIHILNLNDVAPSFGSSHYSVIVPENQPIGEAIFIPDYPATDGDGCGTDQCAVGAVREFPCSPPLTALQYALLTPGTPFQLNQTTGSISVMTALDFEQVTSYTLEIHVTDGVWEDITMVTVNVSDSNDHPPVFDEMTYNLTLVEGLPVGSNVLNVSAVDNDSGANAAIAYHLEGSNSEHFSISSDGMITTAIVLDADSVPTYTLTVVAMDMGVMAMVGQATIHISILNINDNVPEFVSKVFVFNATEELPPPQDIGQVEAFDRDGNFTGRVTFEIAQGQDPFPFLVNSTTGIVTTTKVYDRETTPEFTFNVNLYFHVGSQEPQLTDNATVRVVVADINDNPPLVSDFHEFVVKEDIPVNSEVGRVKGMDADIGMNGQLTYSIIGNRSKFMVDSVSNEGVIYLVQQLDFEEEQSYILTITVQDNGIYEQFSNTTEVTISVEDVDDNPPIFSQEQYSISVPEHSSKETLLQTFFVQDTDSLVNADNKFEIVSVQPAIMTDAFEVVTLNSTVAELLVNQSTLLDREISSNAIVRIWAYNRGGSDGPVGMTTVEVLLLDINDNPPMFESSIYNFSVVEDTDSTVDYDRLIGMVVAMDADDSDGPFGMIYYSIISGNDLDLFTVNSSTGEIFASGALDREIRPVHRLTVQAEDGTSEPLNATTTVEVMLEDVNDNSPVFDRGTYVLQISELAPNGTVFGGVMATDPDTPPGNMVRYALVNDTNTFAIDEQTGSISLLAILDREDLEDYLVIVVATDRDGMESQVEVLIKVKDENDNPPVLQPLQVSLRLREDTALNTTVFYFNLTDEDAESNALSELIVQGDSANFEGTSDGSFILVEPLNFESQPRNLTFSVWARNVEPPMVTSETATVTVEIVDVNDIPPTVTINNTELMVFESFSTVALYPQVSITEMDGSSVSTIEEFKVQVSGPSVSEPSQPFTPSSNYLPYTCPEEDKRIKYEACGFSESDNLIVANELALRSGNLNFTNGVLFLDGVDDAATNTRQPSILLTPDGVSMTTFIWKRQSSSSTPQTIFSKSTITSSLFSVKCLSNGTLQFSYRNGSVPTSVTVPAVCGGLEGRWNHLAVVYYPTGEDEVWRLNVMVNGMLVGWSFGAPPTDDSNGLISFGADVDGLSASQFLSGRLTEFSLARGVVKGQDVLCAIGCGVAIRSTEGSPLPYMYNYYNRTFSIKVSGGAAGDYVPFIDTLELVHAFRQPFANSYTLQYIANDGLFDGMAALQVITLLTFNNHPPTISTDGDDDYVTTFVEEAGPVLGVSPTNLRLSDDDNVAFNYTITVEVTGSPEGNANEVLEVTGLPVGMLYYTNPGNLKLEGFFPISEFRDVLLTLTYNNLADELTGTGRELTFTVMDNTFTDTAKSIINFEFVNDPPVVMATASTDEYIEGGDPLTVLSMFSITDDDDSYLQNATLVLNAIEDDELIAVNSSSEVGIVVQGDHHLITLTGNATLYSYAVLISSLTYRHSNEDNPLLGYRSITITVSDGINTVSASVQVRLRAVNDPPAVDLDVRVPGVDFITIFIEDNDTSVRIASSTAAITDVDNTTLENVVVTLENQPDGSYERLAAGDTYNVEVSQPREGQIILSGSSASLSDFEVALKSVTYVNSAEEPTSGRRVINVTASDGLLSSPPSYSVIEVLTVNDAPYLDLDVTSEGTGFVAPNPYMEEGRGIPITSGNVTVSDNDVDAVVTKIYVTIRYAVDRLAEVVTTDQPVTSVSVDNTTNTNLIIIYLPLNTSIYEAGEILGSLTYLNRNPEPTPGERLLEVYVSDGIAMSNVAQARLSVATVNDNAPLFEETMFVAMVQEADGLSPPANMTQVITIATVLAIDSDSSIDGIVQYQIESGNELGRFRLDFMTGHLQVIEELDREEVNMYSIVVSAYDQGDPSLVSMNSVVIVVMVTDVNDNLPLITTPSQLSVSEVAEVLSPVIYLEYVDLDLGNNAMVTFYLIDSGYDNMDLFMVMENGEIIVTAPLDADTPTGRAEYEITVGVADQGMLSSNKTFMITVINENEFTPVFDQGLYEASFPESVTIETPLLTVRASDNDTGSNGEVEYFIVDPDVMDVFMVDPVSGVLLAQEPLDRETQQSYVFRVGATDQGDPPRLVYAWVNLTLLDVNDNSPSFINPPSVITVAENSALNTTLTTLMATDADQGSNSEFHFQYSGPSSSFRVEPETGRLYVSGPIDYEQYQTLTITVGVVDRGDPPLSQETDMRIDVTDENDNTPVFSQTFLVSRVPEGLTEPVLLHNLSATDADTGIHGNISFLLEDDFYGVFSVSVDSGVLYALGPFDYENICFYNLSVLALDGGSPQMIGTAFVQVYITDEDDLSPRFSRVSYNFMIPENQPAGTFVNQVKAFDPDGLNCSFQFNNSESELREIVAYSLVNNSGGLFDINDTTGAISTTMPLDREAQSRHVLAVQAMDRAQKVGHAQVIVNVADINDNTPMFTRPMFSSLLSEGASVASFVVQLEATDGDRLDTGRLRFSLANESQLPFTVDSRSGNVTVSGALDFEIAPMRYNFVAMVTDSANQSSSTEVIVTLLDSNDLPPVITGVELEQSFTEGNAPLFLFEELSITDPDVDFQLLHEVAIVLVTSEAPNTASECFCNDLCPNGCLELLQINQSLFPGSVVFGNNLRTLRLTGEFPISTYVTALQSVEYANSITNPMPVNRSIQLEVFDGVLTEMVVVTLSLRVFNQFAPIIDLNGAETGTDSVVVFMEESADGIQILDTNTGFLDDDSVRTDPLLSRIDILIENPVDGASEYLQRIVGPLPQGVSLTVDMHTATFEAIEMFATYSDFSSSFPLLRYINTAEEPTPEPRIILVTPTEDQLTGPSSRLIVNIATMDDHPPTFSRTPSHLSYEESSSGVLLAGPQGTISDDDKGETVSATSLTIQLFSPEATDELFIEDPSLISPNLFAATTRDDTSLVVFVSGSGSVDEYNTAFRQVRYRSTLDELPRFGITKSISANVFGPPGGDVTTLNILLTPVNDNLPTFDQVEYVFTVEENTTVPLILGSVHATDGDTLIGTQFNYRLVNASHDIISVDSSMGVLTLQRMLDFEVARQHVSLIEAFDVSYTGPLPFNQARVVINVVDLNDNHPVFDQVEYNLTIQEGLPLNTPILVVRATDIDGPMHSVIIYHLTGSSDFQIDGGSGVISTSALIDQETQSNYTLTVTAGNIGTVVYSSVTVHIRVADFDDNDPVVVLVPSAAILTEPASLLHIAPDLLIQDADVEPTLYSAVVEISSPGYTGAGNLVVHNTVSLSVLGNGTRSLTFNGVAFLEEYQSVLRTIRFYDPSAEPVPGVVLIRYTVIAEEGQSETSTFNLTVVNVNDSPPLLVLSQSDPSQGYNTTFVEGLSAVLVTDSSLSISDADVDSNVIVSAEVWISEVLDDSHEVLSANTSLCTNCTLDRLRIRGPLSFVEMETILKSVR